jgi:segregation and condensation protein B
VSPEPVAALEALLFASPEPLPRERLAELLPEFSAEELAAALAALRARTASPQSGLMLDEVAGGFRLATRPEMAETLARLATIRPSRLSRPALETLAIIAYRQPITKAEVLPTWPLAVSGDAGASQVRLCQCTPPARASGPAPSCISSREPTRSK